MIMIYRKTENFLKYINKFLDSSKFIKLSILPILVPFGNFAVALAYYKSYSKRRG